MGGLESFSFVEKDYVRNYIRLEPICTETLCKYMLKLTEHVEKKFSNSVPDQFALIFDSLEQESRYIVAVFASFPSKNKQGFKEVLLSFQHLKTNQLVRKMSIRSMPNLYSSAMKSHGTT